MIWFPGKILSNGVASNALSDAGDNTHELWFDWSKQREAKPEMSRLLTKADLSSSSFSPGSFPSQVNRQSASLAWC